MFLCELSHLFLLLKNESCGRRLTSRKTNERSKGGTRTLPRRGVNHINKEIRTETTSGTDTAQTYSTHLYE